MDLSQIPGLTATGWKAPPRMSFEKLLEVGEQLTRLETATSWAIGDWWIKINRSYGARVKLVNRVDWRGPSFESCMNAASVCRKFTPSRRREVLSFSHHREVCGHLLTEAEADSWLDWCQEPLATGGKCRSVAALRDAIAR